MSKVIINYFIINEMLFIDECKLQNTRQMDRPDRIATFWPSNFRSLLCTCNKCQVFSDL